MNTNFANIEGENTEKISKLKKSFQDTKLSMMTEHNTRINELNNAKKTDVKNAEGTKSAKIKKELGFIGE